MGLFNWFKKKEKNVTETTEEALPEIKKEDFVVTLPLKKIIPSPLRMEQVCQ